MFPNNTETWSPTLTAANEMGSIDYPNDTGRIRLTRDVGSSSMDMENSKIHVPG